MATKSWMFRIQQAQGDPKNYWQLKAKMLSKVYSTLYVVDYVIAIALLPINTIPGYYTNP